MADSNLLEFRTWPHPAYDPHGQYPEGVYSRAAWLPILGPTAWLTWGTVAMELRAVPAKTVVWDSQELAAAIGVLNIKQHAYKQLRSLQRLCRFRIFRMEGEHAFLVRITAPPVSAGTLRKLPSDVQTMHEDIFGIRSVNGAGGAIDVL